MYPKEELLDMLSSDKASTRQEACEGLQASQDSSPEIVQALEKATQDEDPEVALRATYALQADVHHQMAIHMGLVEPDQQHVGVEDVIEKARLLAEQYAVEKITIEKQLIRIEVDHPNGFSFSLRADGMKTTLCIREWHFPFDNPEEALSAFEKCLSGDARLRDVSSLGIPYIGILEIYRDGLKKPNLRYVHGSITVLFLFLFPKVKKVFRNDFQKTN